MDTQPLGELLNELDELIGNAEQWYEMYREDWGGGGDLVSDVRELYEKIMIEFGKLTGQNGSNGD